MERWVNFYPHGSNRNASVWENRADADKAASVERIACVRVEFDEGGGLQATPLATLRAESARLVKQLADNDAVHVRLTNQCEDEWRRVEEENARLRRLLDETDTLRVSAVEENARLRKEIQYAMDALTTPRVVLANRLPASWTPGAAWDHAFEAGRKSVRGPNVDGSGIVVIPRKAAH